MANHLLIQVPVLLALTYVALWLRGKLVWRKEATIFLA